MFIGHFAVALAGRRAAPRASLGTYFLAAQFLDLLWPTFLLLGIENVRVAPGITAVAPLDFASHRLDLPLDLRSGTRVGLGLWSSLGWTLAVELTLFAGACTLYLGATRARDGVGCWAFWSLVGFLLVAYFAALFGPPPPDAGMLGWAGQSLWLLVAWGYWVDRHRD